MILFGCRAVVSLVVRSEVNDTELVLVDTVKIVWLEIVG